MRRIAALAVAAVTLAAPIHSAAQVDVSPGEAVARARALEETGYHGRARLYLEELIRLDESFGARPEILLELARLTPEWAGAAALCKEALALTRDRDLLFRGHLLLGDAHYAGRRFLSAAREYEKASEHGADGDALLARIRRARSLAAAGDLTTAAELYRDVGRRAEPTDELRAWADLGLARTLLEQGRIEESAELYRKVATERPDSPAAPHAAAGAAEAFSRLGKATEAAAFLQLLEDSFPESFETLLAPRAARSAAPPDTLAPMSAGPDSAGAVAGGE